MRDRDSARGSGRRVTPMLVAVVVVALTVGLALAVAVFEAWRRYLR